MGTNIKESLINAVRERNVIWNTKNKDHQNKFVLANCWSEIGKIVGLPVAEASKQWINLRQEFKKHWEKAKNQMPAGTPTDQIIVPWRYFKSMRFMIDQIEDNSESQLYDDGVKAIKVEPSLENAAIGDDLHEYISMPGSAQSEYQIAFTDAHIPQDECENHDDSDNHAAKKRKLEESYDENDEDIGFFNSLLPHVKKLSAKKKLIFRMKSQNMIFDMLYGETSNETNSNSKTTDQLNK